MSAAATSRWVAGGVARRGRYWSTQRPGVAADRSGGHASSACRSGSSRGPSTSDDDDRPDDERDARPARTRRSRTPVAGSSRGVVGHDHVHGRAGQGQHRPGVGAEHERDQQLRRRPPGRTAITTTTGSSAATAPLTLIRPSAPATSSIIRTSSRVRLVARPVDELLAGPRRHAGRVEALADDEQRRDEDDRRVAEPGERLARGRGCPSPTGRARRRWRRCPTGTRPETNSDDDRRQDREDDRDVAHRASAGRRVGRSLRAATG